MNLIHGAPVPSPNYRPDSDFKAFAYEQVARIGKAVSSAQRLVLLNILVNGPHTVEELAEGSELSIANTSRHLQILKQARLVSAMARGNHRIYNVESDAVCTFFIHLRELAAGHLAELRGALEAITASPTRADRVSRTELVAIVAAGDAFIVDVRPSQEFELGHLPGAVSIPLEELHHNLAVLPRDKTIITYCRGPLCLLADAAVTLLNRAGFQARRTDQDIPSWERAGLPVERGPDSPNAEPPAGG
ncbi:MAG: ArsR family transcriptional regulator [Deltaproteobacteria bacterium HGW-Deltaproteobacteria-14]|jgi:rhodanese-related sulfurtransferase/predicted transcriptional regulator|nr:MAG: ArsR family transcriptional regulator [Deltaproteobacteria bacterium HGW-Deltaproteobacteria-14]